MAEFVLELDRGFISEGGVEPGAVIDGFEEGADALAGVFERDVGFAGNYGITELR